MAMSNAQAGTRGLSAGDWIRLQRLRGARNFETDKPDDITGTVVMPQTVYNKAMLIPREAGTSRIRRPASFWTDFRASQTVDYVTQSQVVSIKSSNPSKELRLNKLCKCSTVTKTINDVDFNIIFLDPSQTLDGFYIGAPIVFSNMFSNGTIIKNGITFYIVGFSSSPSNNFSISQTPGGPIINPLTDGVDVGGGIATITASTTLAPRTTGCKVCSKTPVHNRIQ